MSSPIRPPDGPGAYDATGRITGQPLPARTSGPGSAQGAQFARVYELTEARTKRDVQLPPVGGDRIPDEVWSEVEAAASLVERLDAQGSRVVFDADRLSGRVVANLLDEDGAAQPMRLSDVVDPRAAERAASRAAPPLPGPFGALEPRPLRFDLQPPRFDGRA